MSYAITVLFTGIALLINPPSPSATEPPHFLLARNDAASESVWYSAPEQGGGTIPRHIDYILVRIEDLDAQNTTRSIDKTFTQEGADHNPVNYGVFVLDHERIEIHANATPGVTTPGGPCAWTSATTIDDRLSLDCLPRLLRVCPGCGSLTPQGQMPSSLLGARIDLASGVLTTTFMDVSRLWYFDPQPPGSTLMPQPLAQAIALDISASDNSVTLLSFDLRTGTPNANRTVVLRRSDAIPLVATIGSAPVEDVVHMGIMSEMSDHHYELFWSMMTMPSAIQRPPIPKRVGSGGMPMAYILPLMASGSNCPPDSPGP